MKTRLTGERWVTSGEKRTFDIATASSMVPIALPIGGAALMLSRLLDGEGAVFSQIRYGRNGEPFTLRKIRTMQDCRPEAITDLGRIIRPIAIDEIPQLINILNGDMSVVGPRAFQDIAHDYLEASLPRPLYEEWLYVYMTSRPGGLSTYNVDCRASISDPKWSAETKALMDIDDFKSASLIHDLSLIKRAAVMGLSIARQNVNKNPIRAGVK